MIVGSSEDGTMEVKVIKTEAEYEAALDQVERLIDLDPDVGTKEADELDLLTLLIQAYEAKDFPIEMPDPIDAICFRMEQLGMIQRDLVPFIGSRSKVSEVLSRKRPLTLRMVRALHKGLNIPAEVLLQEHGASLPEDEEIEWDRYPLREMINRGWIKVSAAETRQRAEKLLKEFFVPVKKMESSWALYRRTFQIRAVRFVDEYALDAWRARVMLRALDEKIVSEYERRTVDLAFMREVARLSWSEKGPILAKEFLGNHGIMVVIEPHLPRTHLDGAAFLSPSGNPVIGLTLRYDRLDSFWFTLMHELAHVAQHLEESDGSFFDDLEASGEGNPMEKEADELAAEALIPRNVWLKSPASKLRSPGAAKHLAEQLKIHPAIVAGKMRHEAKNFRILNQLVGHGEVRRLFPKIG